MKIGVISYDYMHLKTEQIVCNYIKNDVVSEVKIYGQPYVNRKTRAVIFPHRPVQSKSVWVKSLSEHKKVTFEQWDGKRPISDNIDVFVIGGAGILDISFAKGKPIVNAHPGIIPISRGLDAFKWAIFNGDVLGVTLHLIDNEVDKGEIIAIQCTPVFSTDSMETLARRHYELEIEMLSNVLSVLNNRTVSSYVEKPAKLRMSIETETELVRKFDSWKAMMLTID